MVQNRATEDHKLYLLDLVYGRLSADKAVAEFIKYYMLNGFTLETLREDYVLRTYYREVWKMTKKTKMTKMTKRMIMKEAIQCLRNSLEYMDEAIANDNSIANDNFHVVLDRKSIYSAQVYMLRYLGVITSKQSEFLIDIAQKRFDNYLKTD